MKQQKSSIWSLSVIVVLGVGGFFLGKEMLSQPSNINNTNFTVSETSYTHEDNNNVTISGKTADHFNNVAPAAGDENASESSSEVKKEETVEPKAKEKTEKVMESKPVNDTEARLKEMEENEDPLTSIRAIGDPNAPVIIEEFSSLSCSHCAAFHNETLPRLKEEYVDTGKVYLIFRDYPLNKPAVTAAGIARCVPSDEYYDFTNVLFRTQREWAMTESPAKLLQTAKLAGLSQEDLDACMQNRDLVKYILATMKHNSQKYEISSTPTFILNDGAKVIKGNRDYSEFAEAIDSLIANPNQTSEEE